MADIACQFCSQGKELEDIAGQLHEDCSEAGKPVAAHHRCMQYASGLTQYKVEEFGGFDIEEVEKEINRGKFLKCFICKSSRLKSKAKGASCGCAVKSCRKTFHYPCAYQDPEAITKRLVVTRNKDDDKEKFVLYRVFCSKAHESLFKQSLKEELRQNKFINSSQESRDYNSPSEKEADEKPADTSASQHNTTDVDLSSPTHANGHLAERNGTNGDVDDDVSDISSVSSKASTTSTGRTRQQRRQSGFVKPPAQRAKRVSQQPRVSLIEEASRESSRTGSTNSETEVSLVSVASEGDGAADVVIHSTSGAREKHTSPTQENKSPNIPPMQQSSPVKNVSRSLSSCFVSLENGLLLTSEGLHKLSPSKHSPAKGADSRVSSPRASGLVNSALLASPGRTPGSGRITRSKEDALPTTPSKSPHLLSIAKSPNPASSPRRANVHNPKENPASGNPGGRTPMKTDTARPVADSEQDLNESESSQQADVTMIAAVSDDAILRHSPRARRANKRYEDYESDSGNPGSDVAPVEKHRKRKGAGTLDSFVTKVARKGDQDLDVAEGCVMLIPGDMDQFTSLEAVVLETVAKATKVEVNNLCVWQQVTLQTWPPHLLIIFILDLVKHLQAGDMDTVLKLLFDGEHIASRLTDFITQAQIFDNVGDVKAQKDIYTALWGGLERRAEALCMLQVVRVRDHDLPTLALDIRACKDHYKILAHLQAYRGLYGWNENTEVAMFHLSQEKRSLADKTEAMTLKVWLTKVTPVTEVTTLPVEDSLIDKQKLEALSEYLRLVEYLKDLTTTTMEVHVGGQALQAVVPLLLFQPVDFVIVNFQQYFQKIVQRFLRERGLQRVMALVPVSNLHSGSFQAISMLMQRECDDDEDDEGYTITACSAFCPETHTTSVVLLQIEATSQSASAVMLESILSSAEEEPEDEEPKQGEVPKKRGRGRPAKQAS